MYLKMRYTSEKQCQLNHVCMAIIKGAYTVSSMCARKKAGLKMLKKIYNWADGLMVIFISYGSLIQCSFLTTRQNIYDFNPSN